MADYQKALKHTLSIEGGYGNDPEDSGGETYKGVARNYHPEWAGWAIIDEYKIKNIDVDAWERNDHLQGLVRAFYKMEYWDCFVADDIPSLAIAMELFDTAVIMGRRVSTKFLQRCLNVLNKQAVLYPDITSDGRFGGITLRTLKQCLSEGLEKKLYNSMNALQGAAFIEMTEKDPVKEKWFKGWLNRVEMI